MPRAVLNKLKTSVEKISHLADFLLKEDGLGEYEVDRIILSTKGRNKKMIECHWEMINGKWTKVCTEV